MAKFYFYKLTVDDGGAPCVENGLLSLAICKPMLRSTAEDKTDDIIFGFAANSLHADNRLIYIARVTKKLTDGEYFKEQKYKNRKDCIYEWTGKTYKVRANAKFHGSDKDLTHDLGKSPDFARANVLLSDDFRYFGGNVPEHYKRRFPNLVKALAGLKRGHRLHHHPALLGELQRLWNETRRDYARKVIGKQSQESRCGVSHRGGGCGVAVPKKNC
ncbi:MAG: hypothetical protein ABR955_14105 [Verrucomicrobiota bacterium]